MCAFASSARALISETFRASLGHYVDGGVGHGINVLAVVSTVFGVATTLGLGIIQINSGLSAVAGVEFGVEQQLSILAGVTVIFLLCAMMPLESGVRYVSDANMLLAAVVLLFVFLRAYGLHHGGPDQCPRGLLLQYDRHEPGDESLHRG